MSYFIVNLRYEIRHDLVSNLIVPIMRNILQFLLNLLRLFISLMNFSRVCCSHIETIIPLILHLPLVAVSHRLFDFVSLVFGWCWCSRKKNHVCIVSVFSFCFSVFKCMSSCLSFSRFSFYFLCVSHVLEN